MDIKEIQQKVFPIFQKYGINRASLFGSYLRGEENKKSDIDFLIDPPKGMSLFDLAGMQIDLQQRLNKPVDLVTYRSVHPLLSKYILSDQQTIYEKR